MEEISFKGSTQRLVIRPFVEADASFLMEYGRYRNAENPDPRGAWPEDEDACRGAALFFAGEGSYWAVCRKPEHRVIGYLSFESITASNRLELGQAFLPRENQDGEAAEALSWLIDRAFDALTVDGVELPGDASLQALGLCEEGTRMYVTRSAWQEKKSEEKAE